MKITREEMEVLRKYIPDVDAIVKSGDVSEFELTLDLSLIHIYSGSGGGKSSGSSKANKDDGSAMIGDLSEDNLQDIALNIYLGTGMQDPLKRVDGTSYSEKQKQYIKEQIKILMGSYG